MNTPGVHVVLSGEEKSSLNNSLPHVILVINSVFCWQILIAFKHQGALFSLKLEQILL